MNLEEINERLKSIGFPAQADGRIGELILFTYNLYGKDRSASIKEKMAELEDCQNYTEQKAVIYRLVNKELEAAYQKKIKSMEERSQASADQIQQLKKRLEEADQKIREKEKRLEFALEKANENQKNAELNEIVAKKNAEICEMAKKAGEQVQKNLEEELERQRSIYETRIQELKEGWISLQKQEKGKVQDIERREPKGPWERFRQRCEQKATLEFITFIKQEQPGLDEKKALLKYYEEGVPVELLKDMCKKKASVEEMKMIVRAKA